MVKSERLEEVRGFIGGLYGPDLHAKRVDALAGATLGVMMGASLAAAIIGQALAQAQGLVTKHAVKQVDRLLSNGGIDVWDSFARWVPQQVGAQPNILVAMNWHKSVQVLSGYVRSTKPPDEHAGSNFL